MKVRKYKDFDEMFLKLNQEILTNPYEMLDYTNGILGYMDNIFIACKNWDCNLDLGKFGYKKNKWPHLLKTYINYFEDKHYNKWFDISNPEDVDREINQIYYSLNKEDIEKEYTKAYNEWGKAIRDKISEANKMLNDLIGGYNKFFEDYNAED